jgi:hypothetical protein
VAVQVFRKAATIAALALAVVSAPLAVQMFSDGFEFLKAVRDRDGDAATKALSEPGNTLVNVRDKSSGETALLIAVQRRDELWTRFLLERGANPNLSNNEGVSPLTLAANLGFIEGVQLLIGSGARVDEPNGAGETPLVSAVHRRDVALIRLLLKHGANPDRADNSGRTARDYAMLMGNPVLSEFERAEKERAAGDTQGSYGPKF